MLPQIWSPLADLLETDPHELHTLCDEPAARQLRVALLQRVLDTLMATEDRTQLREAHE